MLSPTAVEPRSQSRSDRPAALLALGVALAAALSVLALLARPVPAHAQSQNCTLLAQRDSLPGAGSSCWGYVNPSNGNEYAIHGNQYGTAIFNIVNPTAPVMTGFIPGPNSSWREMKTFGNYCYVGNETSGGLQIINLSNPEAPVLAATYTGNGLNTIHSVTIDSTKARLYTNGSNGGMRILSLANPVAPVQLGSYTATYVHDSYATNDTVYAACIGVGQVRILKTTNPASIQQIVAFSTEKTATHNAWPTEDRQYVLATDETGGGRVTSWDISDITSPIQVAGFIADPCADAHNVHVRGDLAYVAHYTSGLQILDISDPTNLVRVGYYDTFPIPAGIFHGAWGTFPYFPSGTIVVSDIEGGMFLIDLIPNSNVDGVVTDAVSGLPLSTAIVSASPTGASDSTDGLGAYRVWLQNGNYTVTAKAFGHDSVSAVVSPVPDGSLAQNFALPPSLGGSISGTFQTGGGAGIASAPLRVKGTPLVATTNGSGAYSFPQVPNGSYTVLLEFWPGLPESATAIVSNVTGNTIVNFTLESVVYKFDFEDTSTAGWVLNADGNDNATSGLWERVNPRGETAEGVQPPLDHSPEPLKKCWITGQGFSCQAADNHDVDDGKTTLYSPVMDLSAVTDPTVEYYRWYSNSIDATPGTDAWRVQISSDGGTTWATTDSTTAKENFWKAVRFRVADFVTPTSLVRVRFIADDSGVAQVVEAGIDDFRIWGLAVVAVSDAAATSGALPARFALYPNSPNPFNPRTEVRFDLRASGPARLGVYTPEGRLVRMLVDTRLPAGPHAATWDGRDAGGREVASGAYLLRLTSGSDAGTRKIVLAK